MKKEQKESILFYSLNDYLIINNLMWGNKKEAIDGYKIAYNDAQGIMKEALQMGLDKRWGVSLKKGKELFNAYKRRFPEILNEMVLEKVLKRAYKDINNITNCMTPSEKDFVVIRNVRISNSCQSYNIDDTILLQSLSSSSVGLFDYSYDSKDKQYIRYIIHIPRGTPILEMKSLPKDIRNEEDEIILPPMACLIMNVNMGNTDNCKKIVEMKFVNLLKVRK